jgi:allantoin racemase
MFAPGDAYSANFEKVLHGAFTARLAVNCKEDNFMPRVLYVMPVNAPKERSDRVHAFLAGLASPGTEVQVLAMPGGPLDLEYYQQGHAAISLMMETLPAIVRSTNVDAVVVACFYDPGVRELREMLNVPVVGIGEASMHVASLLGHKFSIIVARKKCIPKMSDNALLYGFEGRIAPWRSIEFTVQRLHSDQNRASEAIALEAAGAVHEDLAEVVILGCAAMEDMAQHLSKRVRVPVVDPVVAGFKLAEMLGDMRARTGLSISKVYDYEPLAALE